MIILLRTVSIRGNIPSSGFAVAGEGTTGDGMYPTNSIFFQEPGRKKRTHCFVYWVLKT